MDITFAQLWFLFGPVIGAVLVGLIMGGLLIFIMVATGSMDKDQ